MQEIKITVRLADRTVEKIKKIVEIKRELHPEVYRDKNTAELLSEEFRYEAEEYFDRETKGTLQFWKRRLMEKEKGRGRETIWIIRWEDGTQEAAGTDAIMARCCAEEKAKENDMSYIIA